MEHGGTAHMLNVSSGSKTFYLLVAQIGVYSSDQLVNVLFFFSSRRRHTRSVSAFLLNRSSDLGIPAEPLFRSSSWKRFCLFVCRALSSIMVICMLTAIRLLLTFVMSLYLLLRS